MRYRAVNVYLGARQRLVGVLFQYGTGATAITQLVPDRGFWDDPAAPLLSLNARVQDAQARAVFLAEYAAQPFFNGEGERLPAFFWNLLPEGPLRRHLEQIGGVDKGDDFGLLSVCGTDLPGAVYVEPAPLDPKSVARIVTALLHKFELERTDPNPGRSYAMAVTHTVVGRPSCVKRLSTATRTCSSTT